MPNRLKIEITEEGAQGILYDCNHPVARKMPIERARIFLWAKGDELRLASTRAASLLIRVLAWQDGIYAQTEYSPDAVDRLLAELKGHDLLKGRRGEDTSFNAPCNRLARTIADVQRQQDWIYSRPGRTAYEDSVRLNQNVA